jgi:tetrahydromethanopterin S-methyltransferase subunit G
MAQLQNFDAEIEKTKRVVDEMRSKIENSGIVLEKFAQTDQKIGQAEFDIENARIQDVITQQKVMESNIADLIIGLEDATNMFGTEFENMKSFTGWESFVGIFSAESKQRMRTDRVRNMSLAGNLQELLSKSDTIVGILKAQKDILGQRYKTSEESLAKVIERRKSTMVNLEATQKRIEELNPLLLDIENRIAASTNQTERTELEGDRSKLATEYNEKQAKEQELLAESQTLERYTSMFQTFVDSLNNQIAAQNTLINKLTIDTEQRIVLYKALEDSLKTAAQQDVAHKINTLGSKVDNTAEETMAGIGAAAQRHIGDLLELHEKNMVATADIQRRKKLADDAFNRRFEEVLRKHNSADYVQQ